jgi:hypothetical protein
MSEAHLVLVGKGYAAYSMHTVTGKDPEWHVDFRSFKEGILYRYIPIKISVLSVEKG